jgi:hypothetical protein
MEYALAVTTNLAAPLSGGEINEMADNGYSYPKKKDRCVAADPAQSAPSAEPRKYERHELVPISVAEDLVETLKEMKTALASQREQTIRECMEIADEEEVEAGKYQNRVGVAMAGQIYERLRNLLPNASASHEMLEALATLPVATDADIEAFRDYCETMGIDHSQTIQVGSQKERLDLVVTTYIAALKAEPKG